MENKYIPAFNEEKLKIVEKVIKELYMIEKIMPGIASNVMILRELLYSLLEDDDERMRSRFQAYADELMDDLVKELTKKGYLF